MSLPNLHHLYVLLLVARDGGVRRCAEGLGLASSAVARSIAALEDSLQVRLFERHARGMRLTRAGMAVSQRVSRIEVQLRGVRDDALRRQVPEQVAPLMALFKERRIGAAVLLAELHDMPAVARAMQVSPSAISQAITALESSLGQRLFERTPEGMFATLVGRRWIVRFRKTLDELQALAEDVTMARQAA